MNQTVETEVIFKMGCVESSSCATRNDLNKDIESNSTKANPAMLKTNEMNIQQNKQQSTRKLEHKKYKFLCLHGFRTSGQILEYQTASFRISTNLEVKCIDAPYAAEGEPDPDVKMIYSPPAFKYYEWFNNIKTTSDLSTKQQQLEKSVSLVVNELRHQNYDGILGFSQGALVATAVLKYLEDNNMSNLVKCAILIGGVHERLYFINVTQYTVSLPNLHIIGEVDEHKQSSLELTQWYDSEKQQVLLHPEGHRIPTKGTGIYPKVVEWLQTVLGN